MLSQNHLKPNQRLFTVLHPKHVIILLLLGWTYSSKHRNPPISLNNMFHSMRCPFIEIIQMDDWVFFAIFVQLCFRPIHIKMASMDNIEVVKETVHHNHY
jgi:hypothetical protein